MKESNQLALQWIAIGDEDWDSSIQLDLEYLINLTEFAVEMRYSVNPNIDEESLYSRLQLCSNY